MLVFIYLDGGILAVWLFGFGLSSWGQAMAIIWWGAGRAGQEGPASADAMCVAISLMVLAVFEPSLAGVGGTRDHFGGQNGGDLNLAGHSHTAGLISQGSYRQALPE